jgi:hypothetical protein
VPFIVGMTKRTGDWPHLFRRHTALIAISGLALLVLAAPASAHGQLSQVAVSADVADGVATVRAKITYIDGDPNTSANPTATASAAERSVPIVMGESDKSGTYVGKVSLPPGNWHIVVATTGSSRGVGKAEVNVPAANAPASHAARPALRAAGYPAGGAVVLVLVLVLGGLVRRRIKRIVASRSR